VSFVRTVAVGKKVRLQCMDKATLHSEEIKPAAIAIIELCLSEAINK